MLKEIVCVLFYNVIQFGILGSSPTSNSCLAIGEMSCSPQQAQAEKLTLLVAENKTGYFGVYLKQPGLSKPYEAQVWRGGKQVHLGRFATAEEAALCVARFLSEPACSSCKP